MRKDDPITFLDTMSHDLAMATMDYDPRLPWKIDQFGDIVNTDGRLIAGGVEPEDAGYIVDCANAEHRLAAYRAARRENEE